MSGTGNLPPQLNVSGKQRSVMRQGVVHELAPLKIFEVMENDLLNLESTTREERIFTSLSTFFAGIVIPLAIQWPVGETSTVKLSLHYAGTFTCALGFVLFGVLAILWRSKRAATMEVLHRNPKPLTHTAAQLALNEPTPAAPAATGTA